MKIDTTIILKFYKQMRRNDNHACNYSEGKQGVIRISTQCSTNEVVWSREVRGFGVAGSIRAVI